MIVTVNEFVAAPLDAVDGACQSRGYCELQFIAKYIRFNLYLPCEMVTV